MPPLIDTTTDGHVHTRLCNHAVGEMEEYVEKAVQRGLATIIFLEHLEAGIQYHSRSWLEKEEFDYYFREGMRLKERYRGTIDVRLGVEAGYNNPATASTLQEKLAQYPWDRIGLSCHFHYHGGVHLNLLSRNQESLKRMAAIGINQIVTGYFNALIEAIEIIDCDVLCHLDAVLRHYPGIEFSEDHRRQIELLLDGMKKKGVALEINTSGFDYRGAAFPAPWIIKSAMERGLPLYAGSDAHQPEDVGRYFDQLPEYLQTIRG
jgi:histidinol-phosphatase (PHP family)